MSYDQELADGLAIFERLEAELKHTNQLLRSVQKNQPKRDLEEKYQFKQLKECTDNALIASQNAVEAAQAVFISRSILNYLYLAMGLILTFLVGGAFGPRWWDSSRTREIAFWANSEAGQSAYDNQRLVYEVTHCILPGWTAGHENGQKTCLPQNDHHEPINGWFLQ